MNDATGNAAYQLDSQSFLHTLGERAILFDGAMGSMLYERGVFITQCFEQQNLKKPHLVREIHSAYTHAGAEVIESNTFGANRLKLTRHGLDPGMMGEIIGAGVELARDVARRGGAWVAGSVGPVGERLQPAGNLDPEEARDILHEHISAVAETGVDLLVLETFRELKELELAIEVAQKVAPDLPVVALLTPDATGAAADGFTLEQVARSLRERSVAAGGFNDGAGPEDMFRLVQRFRKTQPGLKMAALPMIGGAEMIEDRTIHLATSEFAAVYARRMRREGVRILGLCCGSTPAHIKAMRNALRALQPGRHSVSVTAVPEEKRREAAKPQPAATELGKKIEAGRFVVSVEIDPPQGTDITKALDAVRLLKQSGRVDAINIADGPRAMARMNPASMAVQVQRVIGLEVILHVCCRDRNLLGLQADLLGADFLGLRNLVVITGDPPKMGDYPDATAVFDVDAIGLTRIITRLNSGRDLAGNPIGAPTWFFHAVGANPGAQDLDHEIERLEQKRDAGARFMMTQPVYDYEVFQRFIERATPLGLPILIGILPLASLRNALFLHHNVPGMRIPRPILERMEAAPKGAEGRAVGQAIAREALQQARPMVQGAYIMPPFNSAKAALKVLDAVG